MFVTERARYEWDGAKYVLMEIEGYCWDGDSALCKDHGQDTANKQRQEQLDLQKQAYNSEQQRLGTIQGSLGKYLSGSGEGFDPAMLAALKTQFLNQNSQDYGAAGSNTRLALARSGSAGGNMPVGGDYVRGIAGLEGAEASSRASGLTGIDLQNLQQALANRFNTASVLSGNAATLSGNVGQFGSGASSALQGYLSAKAIPGFGETFGKAFASSLGSGLAGGITGGLGTAASKVGSGNYGF